MTTKGYLVTVARTGIRNDGVAIFTLRSRTGAWPGDRVWLSSPNLVGSAASALLATALACLASDMTAEAWLDDRLQQYDELIQLVVARTGY
jgi:hypothetical protein